MKLDPCPFCDSNNATVITDDRVAGFAVYCHNCGAQGAWKTDEQEAINLWNRRSH